MQFWRFITKNIFSLLYFVQFEIYYAPSPHHVSSRREDRSRRAELEEDRRVMEGVDVELTLGGNDAAENARSLLSERLAQLSEMMDAPTRPTSEDTMPAGEWSGASDKT